MNDRDLAPALEDMFRAGVRAVDPAALVRERVSLTGNALDVSVEPAVRIPLDGVDRVLVAGAGKAAAPMARAVEGLLGDRVAGGLIAVKYGHTDRLSRIRTIEAGHPVPDQNSELAAQELLRFADQAGPRDLVIILISGGGSALLAAPLETGSPALRLTLEDIRGTTGALLRSGATIDEVNCVRKHLSAVKGGRLSARFAPARQLTLILSDVVGDRIDSIASGITAPDPTTAGDALGVLERYGITEFVPRAALRVLRAGAAGEIPDTPKPGDPVFEQVDNVILGGNITALSAARTRAAELGFHTVALSSRMTGEASQVAGFYAALAQDQRDRRLLAPPPACILGGGETTVTVHGSGTGGRNQEMALAFLIEFLRETASRPNAGVLDGIAFLAASTDGGDGPTDAAGAFVTSRSAAAGQASARRFLAENDSYTFFSGLGGLLKTGPTNTNVCDLHLLAVL